MRGFFFTIDSIFALLILMSVVYLFTLVSLESVSSELMQESIYSQAGDMIGMLARLRLSDIWSEKQVRDLYYAGYVNDKDLNNTILEVDGALWSLNRSNDTEAARNLTNAILTHMVPESVHWAFTVHNDTLSNTSHLDPDSRIVTVSRRMVSGYMKSKPHVGFTARAFLSNILGKQSAQYFFFGGFIGEGNLTAVVRGVPSDANVSLIYMEVDAGDNFTMSINGQYCGQFNKSGGNFSADAWNITNSHCIGNISKGGFNNFTINFTGGNLTKKYIGGGYIKVVYDTSQLGEIVTGSERYYFPGIDGLVNLYDSFYVPGELKQITAYLRLLNNYTTTMVVANKTVYEASGTDAIQEIYIQDINFSSVLNYGNLSQVTVPLRLLAGANLTGGGLGIADIVLITDVSGSMDWRIGYDDDTDGSEWSNNCSDSRMYTQRNTQRLALAKCLDKQFISIVLNGSTGNRVALVSFSTSATNTSLSTDALYLNETIEDYDANGGTCICCAINKAREILQAQSSINRKKFIVVMSDGIAGYRCTPVGSCYWWSGETSPTTSAIYGMDILNDTFGFAVGRNPSGGGRVLAWNGVSWSLQSDPATILRAVHLYNRTLGFAVGDSCVIRKWTGSWAADTQPGGCGSTLRSVFVVNGTLAYAVGDNGRVLVWNGATWSYLYNPIAGAGALYAVRINESRNEGFIVGAGASGGSVIYQWTYPTWTAMASPTANTLRALAFVDNSTYRAYAFGDAGRIIRFDGTSWSLDSAPAPAINYYSGLFVNGTLGYAMGANGNISEWDNGEWDKRYSPTTSALRTSDMVNSTLGFAAGDNGRILRWSIPVWNGTETIGYACCNGTSPRNCLDTGIDSCYAAVNNAIWSSYYTNQTVLNLTVDAVGFGPVVNCTNANCTLKGIADAGNGTYYVSSNASELQLIYMMLGDKIRTIANVTQEISLEGNISTTLYPESYLEFDFEYDVPPLGYRDISIIQETDPLGNCSGSFYIPEWFEPYEARVTSYSSNYWTHNVTVRSSNTGNQWRNVFNLSTYLTPYAKLGDPFIVRFPSGLLKSNETNYINVTTGIAANNNSKECPTANRVIYKARFQASVPFSSVLDLAVGRNVTIYYDLNGDGVQDGNQTILLGYGVEGVTFDPTHVEMTGPGYSDPRLHPEYNSIDDAFIRLLDYINFDSSRYSGPGPLTCDGTEWSGSECNPIDVELSPDILIRVSSVTEVPYLWGPIEMGVVAWVIHGD